MPMHDWTRVDSGAFHDFHGSWIYAIHHALNGGLLPAGYYARAEQVAGDIGPDIITLQEFEPFPANGRGGPAVLELAPPKVRFAAVAKPTKPKLKPRRLTIRHASGDRVVAILEIVSRSNKSRTKDAKQFADKILAAVEGGIHSVVIDPFPPTASVPNGFHFTIWKKLGGRPFALPPEQPLQLASYEATDPPKCYVEPLAPGDTLPDMPLFLRPDRYVSLPLELTYRAAWEFIPTKDKIALTSPL